MWKCLNFELSDCMFSDTAYEEVKCASWAPLWKNAYISASFVGVCFFLFPMKTGCPLLISAAVKHKSKLMHALMLLFKKTVYLNLGLRPFS